MEAEQVQEVGKGNAGAGPIDEKGGEGRYGGEGGEGRIGGGGRSASGRGGVVFAEGEALDLEPEPRLRMKRSMNFGSSWGARTCGRGV